MGLTDKLKGLTRKAEETVVEHKDQIQEAVGKAGAAADRRTGGQYHEQIHKAEEKADAMINKLDPAGPASDDISPEPSSPTAP